MTKLVLLLLGRFSSGLAIMPELCFVVLLSE